MIEFSFFPTWLRLTVQFVLLAALAVQVLVCVLSFYRRSFEKGFCQGSFLRPRYRCKPLYAYC